MTSKRRIALVDLLLAGEFTKTRVQVFAVVLEPREPRVVIDAGAIPNQLAVRECTRYCDSCNDVPCTEWHSPTTSRSVVRGRQGSGSTSVGVVHDYRARSNSLDVAQIASHSGPVTQSFEDPTGPIVSPMH